MRVFMALWNVLSARQYYPLSVTLSHVPLVRYTSRYVDVSQANVFAVRWYRILSRAMLLGLPLRYTHRHVAVSRLACSL
jgi:hypothetical protein